MDKVKPGGIIAFITSRGTLDKTDPKVREYINNTANFIGAVRLPNTAFKQVANTEVISDIIFLQKKGPELENKKEWLKTFPVFNDDDIYMNEYFFEKPYMVMGEIQKTTNQYGYTLDVVPNGGLEEQLNQTLKMLPSNIVDMDELGQTSPEETAKGNIIKIDEENPLWYKIKDYTFHELEGRIYYRINENLYEQIKNKTATERIKGLIQIRDSLRELINIQNKNVPDEYIKPYQEDLQNKYDTYTKKFGYMRDKGNRMAFKNDADYPLLLSLEQEQTIDNVKEIVKTDIFFKRTIKPYREVTSTDNAKDALIASINQRGKVDINYIMKLCGKEYDEVLQELKGLIYHNPVTAKQGINEEIAGWETADQYLSGNVVEKLRLAEMYAREDSQYEENVMMLKELQPARIEATDIDVKLGTTWIPEEYITDFIKEKLKIEDTNIEAVYNKKLGKWILENTYDIKGNVEVREIYGTKRKDAIELMEDALNLHATNVYDTIHDPETNTDKSVLNDEETILARQKQDLLKGEFKDWIFDDIDRRTVLEDIYNATFNCIVDREFDGSYLTFPGMNPLKKLDTHQKNAVARELFSEYATLLAHVVGARENL